MPLLNREQALGSKGTKKTKSLFKQFANESDSKGFFTLGDHDDGDYKSLYKIYIDMADETEYEFAKYVFGSYEHWVQLTKCRWMTPYVNRWRKELELLRISKHIRRIEEIASDESNKDFYQANKYLVDSVKRDIQKARKAVDDTIKARKNPRPGDSDFYKDQDSIVKQAAKRVLQ